MHKVLRHATVVAGLGVIAWVGAGYLAGHLLALLVTLVIGAIYLMGVLELHRFHQATATLATVLEDATEPQGGLRPWLERVPASLQNAVRRRIEGEPVGLPGPAMAPTLAGLLVLLGMVGTFLGMVVTLRSTGVALESAADLVAVRNALVTPVKGLGLAFGTSVAGVAASAALGLLAALCRRERVQVAQRLDARIASTLRGFSAVHQREASLTLLQRQADQMPALVDSLQAMMAAMERQAEATQARLLASQERFHAEASAAYQGLASSTAAALQTSLTDSARIAGDTIRPVAEATLAGVARETAALHAALASTMQTQVDQLAARFEGNAATVAESWQTLLQRQEQSGQALTRSLEASHQHFAETFEQRSSALQNAMAEAVTRQLEGVAERLDGTVQRVTDTWHEALAQHARVSGQVTQDTHQALAAAAQTFEQHGASLLRTVQQAQADQQAALVASEAQRAQALSSSLQALAASLLQSWQEAGAQAMAQQQGVCEAMARTARDITAQADQQARHASAEISRLVQVASEAPRAAADVITELRQKLSDTMARDNGLLEERARMLETLGTLLDGVNRAATEQRGAIDALVTSSAEVLENVGVRFGERVQAEAGKLAEVAAQVTGSAEEVANVGEAFGAAVQRFSASNDKLGAQLERIESALSNSMARSDEQLAYYVAQAREVIDLSILSQKQIIEDLQRLGGKQAAPAGAVA